MAYAPTVDSGMSRAEFMALAERGVLSELQVELLEGRVVPMTPQSGEHAIVTKTLNSLLAAAPDGVEVQMPFAASHNSLPEPDLALASRTGADHPTTADLVIEVVWTQWHEAMRKLPIYAAADVGECWIVDIPKRVVHVHDQPAGREYGRTRTLTGGDALTPPGTDIRFAVADVFARLDA
jgi:Uma2 family endonuclease